MSDNPKPASPLPWTWNQNSRGYYIRAHNGDYIYREERYEGGSFTGEVFFDYIVWAANNAPAMAARIERLEAALRKIADRCDTNADIARRALEAE